MNKTLLITHVDLDGISPVILLNLTGIKFDHNCIDIQDVQKTFDELFTHINDYETIYVTDLCLPIEIYEYIKNNNIANIKVFDHHESHLYANNYDFAKVIVDYDKVQTCGTEIFYKYLKELYPILDTPLIRDYVKQVRELDTYNFTSELPREIDSIRSTLGRHDFIKSITKRLKKDKDHFELTTFEKRLVKLKKEETNRYLTRKEEKMFTYIIDNYKVGIVFAENHKSDLGNYLSNNHPELDFIIIIDASGGISYRTSRNDIRTNDFAEKFGGGGHVKASGSRFNIENQEAIIKDYFKNVERIEISEEENVKEQ